MRFQSARYSFCPLSHFITVPFFLARTHQSLDKPECCVLLFKFLQVPLTVQQSDSSQEPDDMPSTDEINQKFSEIEVCAPLMSTIPLQNSLLGKIRLS